MTWACGTPELVNIKCYIAEINSSNDENSARQNQSNKRRCSKSYLVLNGGDRASQTGDSPSPLEPKTKRLILERFYHTLMVILAGLRHTQGDTRF